MALTARGKKIPNWQVDYLGMVGSMQPSPVRSEEPVETIMLIPMGCARLRISAFPWIGEGPGAHEWTKPRQLVQKIPAKASHCWEGDTVAALCDELTPQHSNDQTIPRFTWWPRKGSTEWVEYDFKAPRKVKTVAVYWFDDTGVGGCRTPASWVVQCQDGRGWREVANASPRGVVKDRFNQTTFEEITTKALRLEVKLQSEFSGGILEWQVK